MALSSQFQRSSRRDFINDLVIKVGYRLSLFLKAERRNQAAFEIYCIPSFFEFLINLGQEKCKKRNTDENERKM